MFAGNQSGKHSKQIAVAKDGIASKPLLGRYQSFDRTAVAVEYEKDEIRDISVRGMLIQMT